MIQSFKGKIDNKVWDRQRTKLPVDMQRRALSKLMLVWQASCIDDLRLPPGNNLEALSGDRKGQYSIRINSQWRICFVWDGQDAHDVEIVDYH